MVKQHLYSLRIDTLLDTPTRKLLHIFFKSIGSKWWLIGNQELKKDSGKKHFHGVFKSHYSENKVKKEFKIQLKSLPIWDDPNNFSCCLKKKEGKSIMLNSKKYKQDISNIISYPIKTVSSINSWILLKDFRGIPKTDIIEKFEQRKKLSQKKELLTKKKTKSDFTIIWEQIQKLNLKQWGYKNYDKVVNQIVGVIIEHYSTLSKKQPYRPYVLSLVNSYLIKLDWCEYKIHAKQSIAQEFINNHTNFFNHFDEQIYKDKIDKMKQDNIEKDLYKKSITLQFT